MMHFYLKQLKYFINRITSYNVCYTKLLRKSPPLVVRTLALDTEPPSTPANLRSPTQTETSIELAWDASTDDRGVVGYRLYTASGVVELAATTFTATGLVPDTEYAFQVTAFDAAGNESLPSPTTIDIRTETNSIV